MTEPSRPVEGVDAWRSIESAPRDGTEIQARIPGHGSDCVIAFVGGLYDSEGRDSATWAFTRDQEPPECWTDGYCWSVNEDGVPSVQPDAWMPLPSAPTEDGARDASVAFGGSEPTLDPNPLLNSSGSEGEGR